MKKQMTKLVLAKETVKSLSTMSLVNVAGGTYGPAACGNPAPSERFCLPGEIGPEQ